MSKASKVQNKIEEAGQKFHLKGEKEGQKDLDFGKFSSLDKAKQYIDEIESRGNWKEGYDAVATEIRTGKRWLYSDDWEAI